MVGPQVSSRHLPGAPSARGGQVHELLPDGALAGPSGGSQSSHHCHPQLLRLRGCLLSVCSQRLLRVQHYLQLLVPLPQRGLLMALPGGAPLNTPLNTPLNGRCRSSLTTRSPPARSGRSRYHAHSTCLLSVWRSISDTARMLPRANPQRSDQGSTHLWSRGSAIPSACTTLCANSLDRCTKSSCGSTIQGLRGSLHIERVMMGAAPMFQGGWHSTNIISMWWHKSMCGLNSACTW